MKKLPTTLALTMLLATNAFAHDAKDSSAFRPDTRAVQETRNIYPEAPDGTITGNFATVPMGVSHPDQGGAIASYLPLGTAPNADLAAIAHVPATVQGMDSGHAGEGAIQRTVQVPGTRTDPSRGSSWAGNPGDCDPAMGDGCADRLTFQK